MFRKEKYKTLCERVLREVADRHGIEIRELSVLPDHIHIVAAVPPTMAPVKAEQLLKGASAYKIFREAPKFRFRYPRGHLWSPGKFHNSVGYADLDTVEKYVRSQVEKHGVTFL
jgi:putative transposase